MPMIFVMILSFVLGSQVTRGEEAATKSSASEKSPEQIEWEKKIGPDSIGNPAFAFVKDNPALPRVLLIGDSISIGYTPVVRELLAGKANVHRIPVNGGPSSRGVQMIDEWLGKGKWDVIHFNFGLHDLKLVKDATGADVYQVPLPEYEKNLETIVQKLEATGAKLIWGNTTPVPADSPSRIAADEVKYNEAAAKIMKSHKIHINDLHDVAAEDPAKYQLPANVHFNKEGYDALGRQAAKKIGKALKRKEK